MARNTFIVYTVSLVALLIFFISVAIWGSSQPGFKWKVAKPNGPFWQIAMFLFMYSGIVSDVAFIRTAVVLANLFITAWVIFGVASWPNIWFSVLAEIHYDQLIWCFLCVFVNALPMFRQFKFDDSKKKFEVGKKYVEMAESVWREWWRRSGIPRTDFKTIVEAGEWMELSAGEVLEMKETPSSDSDSEGDNLEDGTNGDLDDIFYYVVRGKIHCQPAPGSGRKDFTLSSGYFCDAFALMTLLGQTTVCMAMQMGPNRATVLPGDGDDKTAVVIKWSQKTMVDKIIRTHGFAPLCLKTVVSSATLDSLYKEAVQEDHLEIFDLVEKKRKELAQAPLDKKAAMPQRSFWQQFKMSHISLHDLWEPSPHQRVVNAISTGSRELTFRKEIQVARENLSSMRAAVSESSHV
mmetsp:Transcript_80108/g.208176  ORF Transcript_80108/g.208176 Transcript_80108/m.208176 type:complete len:407 (-) Transcript_80108:71-1291(-)